MDQEHAECKDHQKQEEHDANGGPALSDYLILFSASEMFPSCSLVGNVTTLAVWVNVWSRADSKYSEQEQVMSKQTALRQSLADMLITSCLV